MKNYELVMIQVGLSSDANLSVCLLTTCFIPHDLTQDVAQYVDSAHTRCEKAPRPGGDAIAQYV